jgi:two-component system, NtrC family, response regulator AtoC
MFGLPSNQFKPAREKQTRENRQRLIYFVDDDKLILNLLDYTFQNLHGYEVRTFQSGRECLDNIHANPSLVVIDHEFEGKSQGEPDGFSLCKKIRSTNPSLPVIVLSGHEDPKLIEKYETMGVSRYLLKQEYFIDALTDIIAQLDQEE